MSWAVIDAATQGKLPVRIAGVTSLGTDDGELFGLIWDGTSFTVETEITDSAASNDRDAAVGQRPRRLVAFNSDLQRACQEPLLGFDRPKLLGSDSRQAQFQGFRRPLDSWPGFFDLLQLRLHFIVGFGHFRRDLVAEFLGRQLHLPVAAAGFITDIGVEWGRIMAMGTLIVIPPLLFTFFAARQIIAGMTAGAVKG